MEETVAHIISPSESHMFLMDCAPLLQQMAHTHYTAFIDAGSYGCSCFAHVCAGEWRSPLPQWSSNVAERIWAAVGLSKRVASSAAHAHRW